PGPCVRFPRVGHRSVPPRSAPRTWLLMSSEVSQHHLLEVVVVEDTPDLRDLLRMALKRSGDFTVVGEADNGRQGVEMVRARQPDVVVLDIAMPEMDGLEALPLLREACPTCTVVMLSGFGTSEMTRRA